MAKSSKDKYDSFGKDPDPWRGEIPNTSFENYEISNIVESVNSLFHRGQYIELQHKMNIPEFEYINVNNHFQGILRLKDSNFIILSGASKRSKHAHLFIAHIGSKNPKLHREIGTNILFKDIPSVDELKEIICISKDVFWHAGGISSCGDILVIPLEGEKEKNGKEIDVSKIIFYNIKNPLSPVQYPKFISRINQKAGASTLVRIKNRFLCAVWTDSDNYGKRFDFYLSKSGKLIDGFKKTKKILLLNISNRTGRQPRFQTIEFIKQSNGELFIIGYLNTRKAAPVINGRNKCYIYKCNFALTANRVSITMSQVYTREFDDGGKQYNMGGACGSHIQKNGKLLLYSAHHWKTRKSIKLAEFAKRLNVNNGTVRSIKNAVIECYEHRYFKGRCLLLYANTIHEIESFKKIKVQGKKFNDKLSSLKYQIPKTYKIILYEHEYYKGKRTEFLGTGKVKLIPVFNKFNDKVSSLKLVKM